MTMVRFAATRFRVMICESNVDHDGGRWKSPCQVAAESQRAKPVGGGRVMWWAILSSKRLASIVHSSSIGIQWSHCSTSRRWPICDDRELHLSGAVTLLWSEGSLGKSRRPPTLLAVKASTESLVGNRVIGSLSHRLNLNGATSFVLSAANQNSKHPFLVEMQETLKRFHLVSRFPASDVLKIVEDSWSFVFFTYGKLDI